MTVEQEFSIMNMIAECHGRQLGDTYWLLPTGAMVTADSLEELINELKESIAHVISKNASRVV